MSKLKQEETKTVVAPARPYLPGSLVAIFEVLESYSVPEKRRILQAMLVLLGDGGDK